MFFKGNYGPMLIAEIGGNHEGDFVYANDLTDIALDSKADVIKYQIYTPDSLVNKNFDLERYEHFKKFTLSIDQHLQLAEKCIKHGKKYLASVWDPSAIDLISEKMDFFKIGSGDLTAFNIIDQIVKKGKPIIISTGLASYEEVVRTIKFIQNREEKYLNRDMLAVLQCTSMYPNKESNVNLKVMKMFEKNMGVTVGYSDHTEDLEALHLASIFGARVLEFHFTDTKKDKTFRDHKVSLTKNDLEVLINKIHRSVKILGDDKKIPTKSEVDSNHITTFRRGLFLNKNMKKGSVITKEDVVSLRPNVGLDASNYFNIIGKKINQDISRFDKLKIEMFE